MKVRRIAYLRKHTKRSPNYRKSWRAYMRHAGRHLKVGTIIETCSCDVARIVSVNLKEDDCEYQSLTRPDGGTGNCSIYNCGPKPLNKVAVQRRLDIFKQGGMKALVRRYWKEDCWMTDKEITMMELDQQ